MNDCEKGSTSVRTNSTFVIGLSCLLLTALGSARADSRHADSTPAMPAVGAPEKIIIDTDIGDDIDDAFAVALALRSPELNILGITTDSGNTELRAKILDRMLGEVGRSEIPVAAGAPTVNRNPFPMPDVPMSQARYGEGGHFARASHLNAVDFITEQIQRYPGQITLVTIGPVPNIGALIDKSPDTFRKLKRVVLMGGSIEAMTPVYGDGPPQGPVAEWNIQGDIPSSQKLFGSGVPLYVMPLDSTAHLQMDELKRNALFAQGTPLSDALALLYHQFAYNNPFGVMTPTLFDPMTLAYILDPTLCPVKPLHIRVDDKGFTRVEPGTPNAQVCVHSDPDAFFRFYMQRLIGGPAKK